MLQLSEDAEQAPFQWRNSQKAPKYPSPLLAAGISSYDNSHSSLLSTSSFRTIAAHPSQSPSSAACSSTSSPSSFISSSQSSSTASSYQWRNPTCRQCSRIRSPPCRYSQSSPTSAFRTPMSCALLHGLTTISWQICALSSPRDPPSSDPHHRR
jgi:hypothetical protein